MRDLNDEIMDFAVKRESTVGDLLRTVSKGSEYGLVTPPSAGQPGTLWDPSNPRTLLTHAQSRTTSSQRWRSGATRCVSR